MKKKLLFVIDSLVIGGAEKSLVALLNMIDSTKYEIDLLLFKQGGDLENYLPNHINILPVPEYFSFLCQEHVSLNKKLIYLSYRIKTSINLRLNELKNQKLHSEQVVYKSLQKIFKHLQKHYDVAIAYSQGMPTYFVANKIKANRKIAWINTDYVTTLYNKDFDYNFYQRFDKIVTVSKHIKKSFAELKSNYEKKANVIKDIVNPVMIRSMAEEFPVIEFDNGVNFVTVGRLVSAKGYERAIQVAILLKNEGYQFKWYVVGEGPDKEKLQKLINLNKLGNHFILLGKKVNPYPYMKNCDVYIQPSVKEGFGLTVCEAKILNKPIVCTNFPTASEIITNNLDGLIVEHNVESICDGIKKYLDNKDFRDSIQNNLRNNVPYNSVSELETFYKIVKI